MSNKLIESIVEKDYISAEQLFEQKINQIAEQKLYERKKFVAAQINEAMEVQPDPEGRVRGGETKTAEQKSDPWISRRTREKIEQLRKGKKGFRGLAADVLGKAKKKFERKPKPKPADISVLSQKAAPKSGEVHGYSPSAIIQRAKLRSQEAGEAAEKKRATQMAADREKSAWERSAGGKTASVLGKTAKLAGRIVAGAMSAAE